MDGDIDYMVVSNSNSININTFTISMWVKLSDLDTHHVLLHKRNGQWHANYQISYYANDSAPGVPLDDYLFAGIGDGSYQPTAYSSAAYAPANVNVNEFFHIAATYDQEILKLFVNGVEVASKDITMPNITGNGDLYIGAHPYHSSIYASYGVIDEVRIYNYALTQEEIQADMEACTPEPNDSGCINLNGQPLANKEVTLKQQGGPNLTAMTDSKGFYEFEDATVGKKIKIEFEGPQLPESSPH